jgi:23S rRNA pseudouridine1911/1915/1917 synthase
MISLIYETKDFLAVNKPAGILVHPIKNSDSKELTLVDWILKNYPEIRKVGDEPDIRPGIVHRLDRDTSGIILIARNQAFFEYLKNLFKNHKIKKTYLALVWGKLEPKSGKINIPIGIKTGTIKRTVWNKKSKDFKEALTEYRVVKSFKFQVSSSKIYNFSLVELMPKTGRTHQIRIHLASINHPVVGDEVYGFKKRKLPVCAGRPFELNRQFLHAFSLEFTPEAGQRIKLEAELPEDLKNILSFLEE